MRGEKGFTLIELLIVIAVIAILAGVAFVALNPLQRFRDARDAKRWSDVTAVLSALKIDQVDNGGKYNWAVQTWATADTNYLISNATTSSGCNLTCGAVTLNASCINVQSLANEGYLAQLPIGPDGNQSWDATFSGYYLTKRTNGSVTIGSCDTESPSAISVQR